MLVEPRKPSARDWALSSAGVHSGLVDISAAEDEEEELAHWVWSCDSENLSNVEEVAGKQEINSIQ